jgi:hypothetical protein
VNGSTNSVKKTLETGISSRIKRNMTKAVSAVRVSATIGDNMIMAFEFSTLGISFIIAFLLQP